MRIVGILSIVLMSAAPGAARTSPGQTATPAPQPAELQAACDKDNFDSCNRLGLLYYSGNRVAKNEVRADQLFDKACTGGLVAACDNLGRAYASGRGVPKNDPEAVRLYRHTCENGGSWGCTDLGWMELSGRG